MSPLVLAAFGLYAVLLVHDLVRPARAYPAVRFWRLKGLLAFLSFAAASIAVPLLTDAWFAEHRLVDATGLGPWAGAALGFVVLQLGTWLWHRALHASDLLFRLVHQVHHSPERLDAWAAFWFSPLDVAGLSVVGGVCLVLGVGISGEAALLVGVTNFVLNAFQHSNLRTPRWLGYVVVRPESHAVHHERGVHAHNYCNLPLVDLLFGTFHNPPVFEGEVGFWDGASRRLPAMLVGLDVSRPPTR